MKKYFLLTIALCFSLLEATSQCNNITHPGEIGIHEPCNYGAVPSLITNLESPTGGDTTKPIEYVWLMTTDSLTTTGINWNVSYVQTGSLNTLQYSYPITIPTWFRRCARREGCTNYIGESNWLQVLAPNTALPVIIKSLHYNSSSIEWELENPYLFYSCTLKGSHGKSWVDVTQVTENRVDISKYSYQYYQLYFYDVDDVLTKSEIIYVNKSIIEDTSLMGSSYIIYNIDGRVIQKGIYNRCIHIKENEIIIFL